MACVCRATAAKFVRAAVVLQELAMTKLEQLRVQKALLEGRMKLLQGQLAEVEAAIRQVERSLREQEANAGVRGVGVRRLEVNGRVRRNVKG